MSSNNPICAFCSREGVIECKDCPAILCQTHDEILHSLENNKSHERIKIGNKNHKEEKEKEKQNLNKTEKDQISEKENKAFQNKKLLKHLKTKQMCSTHSNKQIEFYCFQCKKFLCSLCLYNFHREHENVRTLEEIIQEHKNKAKSNKKKLRSSLEFSQKMHNQLQLLNSKIRRNSGRLQEQLIVSFDHLLSVIEQKKNKVIEDIDNLRNDKEEMIQLQCESLKESISKFEDCLMNFDTVKEIERYDITNQKKQRNLKPIFTARHFIKIQNSLNEFDLEPFSHLHDPFEMLDVDLNPIYLKCQELALTRKRRSSRRNKSRGNLSRDRKSFVGINASPTNLQFTPREWSDLSFTDNFSATTTNGSSTSESELSDDEWWEREENREIGSLNKNQNGNHNYKNKNNSFQRKQNDRFNNHSQNNNNNNNNNNQGYENSGSSNNSHNRNSNNNSNNNSKGTNSNGGNNNKYNNINNKNSPNIENGKIRVLLIAAQSNESCRENVRKSLQKSNLISEIRIIKAHHRTPTYEEIRRFDCLFIYSFDKFKDPVRLGDLIATFVESGGGVVISAIEALSKGRDFDLEGRIITGGFLPLKKSRWESEIRRKLDKFDKEHPILAGVESFDGGNYSSHLKVKKVEKGSRVIATWNDGTPLICEKKKKLKYGNVVVLNFHPLSDEITYNDSYFWVSSTDGAKIMSNSVEYVAKTSTWRTPRVKKQFHN
ncbi:bonus isoform c-related [Anaeramoeba flamelloides]|uniref:Bonus isoform c-related n=1 Tax=Anaeramoeba flamelloides TaxID=1746091 RepID=A0AAV7Y7E6_9EUKA|nr:bonus isoform c-related [Anaeramoeba flamelloides]